MLRKIKKFVTLSHLEKRLFIQAFFVCGFVRIMIFVAPMRWYAKSLGEKEKESSYLPDSDKQNEIQQVLKALRRAIRYQPGKTKCLARAISAKKLLLKKGIPSTLYLGVAKESTNRMIAHAWLKCGSDIITGKEEMSKFTVVAFFT